MTAPVGNLSVEVTEMSSEAVPVIHKESGVTVITLGPEYESLDEDRLVHLQETLLETAQNVDPPRVVLDLSHTRFFGSAFIEVIFRIWNRLNSKDKGAFAICGLTPYCAEIFEVTHLNKLWPVFDTAEDAVAAISQN